MMECKALQGRIHSLESFGTVDGPGIRFVVFFQGCPLRCLYCHNPDTWDVNTGTLMTVEDILQQYEKNKSFYQKGGLTATGGEPLLQLPFLTQLFTQAQKQGIHTCLDTSGILYRQERAEEFSKLFACTNLVLLDIKHSDTKKHRELTGQDLEPVLAFARALEHANVPMVVRHVLVPGKTDDMEHLEVLAKTLRTFRNLRGLEILPYHTMGLSKYEAMKLAYPLAGVPNAEKEDAKKAREMIISVLRDKSKDY